MPLGPTTSRTPTSLRAAWASSLVVVAFCAGCGDASVVDVRMLLTPGLDSADTFTSIEVRFDEASTGTRIATAIVDVEALRAGTGDLGEAVANLERGHVYRASVVGRTATASCARDRVVGLSLPFTDVEGGYLVPVQAGCADELGPTRGASATRRIGASLAVGSDGEVVIVGGAEEAKFDGMLGPYRSFVTSIERYDPRLGRFELAGSIVEPRASAAAVSLPSGSVAVLGGYDGTIGYCASMIELIGRGPGSVVVGALAQRRCVPAAVVLRGVARVAVVGGAALAVGDRTADAEVYDDTMRTRTSDGVTGAVFRIAPAVEALGDGRSALVVGGTVNADGTASTPQVELLRIGAACGSRPDDACFTAIDSEDTPTGAWSGLTAGYVPCATGGGAVYVVGGLDATPMSSRALDAAYCYRDATGDPGRLVRAGRLDLPRANHAMQVVRAADGGFRLLLVGGSGSDSTTERLPYEDAVLVPVDGCSCAPVEPGRVEHLALPFSGFATPPVTVRLGDGSVLVRGSFQIDATDTTLLLATRDAALFIPDLR